MIKSATADNNAAQAKYAKALGLETALLRQNSQMRGFLVTADESYLKSITKGATTMIATLLPWSASLRIPACALPW